MLIAIIGESCVGKSTLADALAARMQAKVYSGRDYLRLAKTPAEAEAAFRTLLTDALSGDNVIYVISEREHLPLLPDGAFRVLVTAPLEVIEERFAARMHGHLPPPVKQMLERKHGCFDQEAHDLHIDETAKDAATEILAQLAAR